MAGYHIGRAGPARCRAEIKCPLGGVSGSDNHFGTLKEAQSSYEETMQQQLFATQIQEKLKIHRNGERKPRGSRFASLSEEELKDLQKRAMKHFEYFKDYEHDYSQDKSENRPGEVEYLSTYDLRNFGGRDTSSDSIIIKKSSKNEGLEVLMILRGNHPYKNTWAHPGGFLNYNETISEGAVREVREETGVEIEEDQVEYVGHYDHPNRDPRGPLKMNTSLVIAPVGTQPIAGDDAAKVKFISVKKIFDGSIDICADHRQSIKDALDYLLLGK